MKIENTELNLHLKDSDQRLFEGLGIFKNC